MGLVFCTPVMVSLWGHLKYWHKTETPASLFWLASCQHQLAHALQKGKQDCLRASKAWRSQQRQRFVHTHDSTLQLLSTVVADTPRELQDLVVLSLAPLSPRIQFLGRACISRCTMHFSNHPLLLAGFFFFSQDPLWCLKTCLQKFLSYDGRSLSWKSESVSHSSHVWL